MRANGGVFLSIFFIFIARSLLPKLPYRSAIFVEEFSFSIPTRRSLITFVCLFAIKRVLFYPFTTLLVAYEIIRNYEGKWKLTD